MPRQELATLLIEDDPTYVEFVENVARGDSNVRLRVTHVASLAEALRVQDEPEIALLDFSLPDSHGLRATRKLKASLDCPIVVLTDAADEMVAGDTVRLGAEEYLVKERTDPALLLRAIRYAVERRRLTDALTAERQTAERERELRQLERLTHEPTSVTATAFGLGPLREREPATWQGLIEEYRRIIILSLRERAFRLESSVTADLTSLAQILGYHGATPREVVELHTTGLKAELAAHGPRVRQELVEEGRVLALEMMGTLASYYRARAAVRRPDGEVSRRAPR